MDGVAAHLAYDGWTLLEERTAAGSLAGKIKTAYTELRHTQKVLDARRAAVELEKVRNALKTARMLAERNDELKKIGTAAATMVAV